MPSQLPPGILAAIKSLLASLASVRPAHVEAIVEAARDIARRLEERLKGLAPGRYQTQEVRSILVQVRSVIEALGAEYGQRLGDEIEAAGRVASQAGRDGLAEQLAAWEEVYPGASRPLVDAAAASDVLDPGLLDYYETSRDTYGAEAIVKMRKVLMRAALEGLNVAQTAEQMAAEIEMPEWKAERIVRTEQAFASGRRQILDLIDTFGDEAETEWRKQLIATLDDRTGEDSKYVNGQIRKLLEEFEDNEERRYQHPPNRPNDREVMVFLPPGAADVALEADVEREAGEMLNIAGDGDVLMDPSKLDKIVRFVKRLGAEVDMSKSGEEYLRRRKAGAIYSPRNGRPGEIVWKRRPTRLEVVEELIHLGQHRKRGWKRPSAEEIRQDEIEAQHLMLALAKRKGWTQGEIDQIQSNLDEWKGAG